MILGTSRKCEIVAMMAIMVTAIVVVIVIVGVRVIGIRLAIVIRIGIDMIVCYHWY